MRRTDRQKILDYFMGNRDFKALSPEATLLWFDLAFYLHERDLTVLTAHLAKGNVLDDLFSRNRVSPCAAFIEELCRFSLIRREHDGSLVCCFLEELQQGRAARAQRRQTPVAFYGSSLGNGWTQHSVSLQANRDRRSLTSRENGRKGGRPPKQKNIRQPSLLLPIGGGKSYNLKNLKCQENRFLGFRKLAETPVFSPNLGYGLGYLGFSKEKEKEIYININSSLSLPSSKPDLKPNTKPKPVSDELIAFVSVCMDQAGIEKTPSSIRKQLWQGKQWLDSGIKQQTVIDAIGYLTAKMRKNGEKPMHLGVFARAVETFRKQESAVGKALPAIEQAKKEDLQAEEAFRKDLQAWQKRYEFSHDFTELAKMPRLENYLSRKSA